MKININTSVRVKLTDEGRRIHRAQHDKLYAFVPNPYTYRAPPEDSDGWSTWQLWVLMNTFGPKLHNGCKMPFETEIDIPS
jgi:hypothetical protein